MNNTPNINLSTYTSDPNDKFNLLVTFNNNMNKIDTAVGSQNDQIEVIEETASTAVTTANTASTTANTALTTANSKASIDDLVSSTTTTYSSDKIDDLISGAGGAEIDDSVTSLTKTWSSSKINTEISSKASINDTTAGSTTTYSSNKIDDLLDDIDPIPYTGDSANTVTNHSATLTTINENLKKFSTGTISITEPGYYYLSVDAPNEISTDRKYCFSTLSCNKGNINIFTAEKEHTKRNNFSTSSSGHITFLLASNIYYLPANCTIDFSIYSDYISTPYPNQVQLHKIN